ncbi:MAG: cytochrome c [Bacteroidota bacterium]
MRRKLITVFSLAILLSIAFSCQNSDQLKQQIYYTNGRDLYINRCQNCHGSKGEGLSKLAPPLTDSIFLMKNKHRLACMIKHGSDTTVIVHNEPYDGKMPDNPKMADIDIAQLIVYITNTFGNKQGIYSPEEVAKDLKECK